MILFLRSNIRAPIFQLSRLDKKRHLIRLKRTMNLSRLLVLFNLIIVNTFLIILYRSEII